MNGQNANGTGNGKAPAAPKMRNHVAIVLDESGSMDAMRQEAIDAFNQQVQTIRTQAADQETTVSLVKFNTTVPNPVYWAVPASAMRRIGPEDYAPNGLTAMLDAVGLTIDRLKALPDAGDENTSFLLLIVSDGMENNSKGYTYADIAERIQELDRTDRWTFTYLGANQDLSQVERQLHIPAENMSLLTASGEGMRDASLKMQAGHDRFFAQRRAGMKSSKAFYAPDPQDAVRPPEPPADGEFWAR